MFKTTPILITQADATAPIRKSREAEEMRSNGQRGEETRGRGREGKKEGWEKDVKGGRELK